MRIIYRGDTFDVHIIADNIPLNFLGIYDCFARLSVWLIIGWYTYKGIENTK